MRYKQGTLHVDCAICGAVLIVPEQSVLDGRRTTCEGVGGRCGERRTECSGVSCARWGDRLVELVETPGLNIRAAAEVVGIARSAVWTHARVCDRLGAALERVRGLRVHKRARNGIDLEAPEAPAGWLDGRSRNTAHTYAIRWRFWQEWCARNGRTAIPARRSDLIEYLIDRAECGTAPKTLMVDCCAIRAAHLARPLPDPTVGLRRIMQPYTHMAGAARAALRKAST